MRWETAITVAPRTPAKLPATIASLAEAGWDRLRLFCEPGSSVAEKPPTGVRYAIYENESVLGSYWNFRQAAQVLSEIKADAYLLCQDDIDVSFGLREWLENDQHFQTLLEDPEVGVISLYTARPNHRERDGWHELEEVKQAKLGALAYVFAPDRLRKFVSVPPISPRSSTMTDYWVARWALDNELEFWCHSPSFVRHTGTASTFPLTPGIAANRQCQCWLPNVSGGAASC